MVCPIQLEYLTKLDQIPQYTKVYFTDEFSLEAEEKQIAASGKPVIKKIRKKGMASRILQMDFVTDPHGKLTYSDDIKIRKFRTMYQAFKGWHKDVFFYLCMEKAAIWQAVFGRVYTNNDDFEKDMLQHCMAKIDGGHWIVKEILQ